jgi:fluoride exporter
VTRFLLVCLAGAVGSGLRYLVVEWADRWGVLAVNVGGSFLIAVVSVIALSRVDAMSDTTRLALSAGFLGGFTTYSSFNQATLKLLSERSYASAVSYTLITLIACLVAGIAGTAIAKRFG